MTERSDDVLVEGNFTPAETGALLDAAQAAVDGLSGRKTIAPFVFKGQKLRAKATRYRLHVSTADNRRFIAYRWID